MKEDILYFYFRLRGIKPCKKHGLLNQSLVTGECSECYKIKRDVDLYGKNKK